MAESSGVSRRQLLLAVLGSAAAAVLIMLVFVLPAEYGADPTGLGEVMGLTRMSEPGSEGRVIQLHDVIGCNEVLREVEIPPYGEPVPLPNPAVHQPAEGTAKRESLTVHLPAESQTEIKLYMVEGAVALYRWRVSQGDIYEDFHGHDPSFGEGFFVRYQEQQQGREGHGSLVAPFDGEHGWYWLNYNDFDVDVELEVSGYYEDIIDHGLF